MMAQAPFPGSEMLTGSLPDGSLIEQNDDGNVLAFLPDGSAKLFRIYICDSGIKAIVTDIPPFSIEVR